MEYCHRTDYRMLISEIGEHHKKQMEDMSFEFEEKYKNLAHNEKLIQLNVETLQKFADKLDKERANERQMRMKLEEEYV